VVGLIVVSAAAVRHFLNRHDAGDPFARIGWTLPVAAVALAGAVYLTVPQHTPLVSPGVAVTEGEALAIVGRHCVMCHSARPTHTGLAGAPSDVILTSVELIRRHGAKIIEQAVQSDAMPLGDETGMTTEERQRLGAFIQTR
jgi:uncharacterized membrane protein